MSLADNIKKNATKHYIGYTNGKSFVEFHFRTNYLYLTMMSGTYNDPLNKIRMLDGRYNWSNNNRLDIYEDDDIEYLKTLLKQCYEKTLR